MKFTFNTGTRKVTVSDHPPSVPTTNPVLFTFNPADGRVTTAPAPAASQAETPPEDPPPEPLKPVLDISQAVAVQVDATTLPASDVSTQAASKAAGEDLPASVQALVDAIASTEDAVQQELVDGDGNAVIVRVQRRNNQSLFELLRQHDIFEYTRMEIGVGTVNTRLSFDNLGISEDQRKALNAVKAKGSPVEMFPALKEAGSILRGMLVLLKTKHMTYTGGAWICTDVQLPTVAIELEKIQQRCLELREGVVLSIPGNKKSFLEGIAAIVLATNARLEEENRSLPAAQQRKLVDMEAVLLTYQAGFPTAYQVRNWFRFEVDGPIHNPSLTQQAEGNARLKEAMNRFQSANLQKTELDAVQRAFDERQRKLQDAVASGMEYARAQVIKSFAGIVSSLTNSVDRGRVHGTTKTKVTETIANMKAMLAQPFVPQSFGELLTDAEQFNSMIQSDTWSAEQMQSQLDAALHKLQDKYEFKPPVAESGHRAGYVPNRRKTEATEPVTQADKAA